VNAIPKTGDRRSGTMNDVAVAERALEDLVTAASKLPTCDRAARLHALLARLVLVTRRGEAAASCANELASAATEALEHDPWVLFERAARRVELSTGTRTAAAPVSENRPQL
jgi:hypothetical protein